METKFQYTVLVYTQGREIPDELTIEVAENNLRLNKCLKDKIANYIKPGHFIYSARNTITIDGEEISTNKVIEDEGTIPTTNFIARLRLEPKIVLDAFVVPSVTQKRSYNRSQSKSPYSQNQGSGLSNRSQELVSSTTENNGRSKKRLKQIKEDDSDVLESVKNKQSISNVSAPTFEEIMQQKGYCIIENSTEIPVPHTCQCDKQLKQQESFNWFQYQKEPIIRMDFPFVENELLAEPKATKLVVNHFKQVFKNELDHFGYEIIDVSSGNKLPLSIKFNTDHKIIETINGRTDVVIAPKGQSELNNICIGIEIKTPVTISCPKSFRQFVLQFIGALIKFSNIPMLFLSTDLETFKFLWLSDPNKKIIRLFQTRDYRYSIYFMKQFIAYHHDHRSISIDYKSSVITPNIKSNKEMNDKERKKKVEEAYESYSAEGKLEKFDSSRTESVFKIEIEEKPYVLKMANYHSKRNIYKELEIEHEIYEYLSNLREEIGDCFPQLYYAGPIRDGDFAIVTSYIEGKRPAKNWTNPWESKLCKKVLDKINSAGVLHGDARSANFIIVDEQPYTNEFDTYKKTAYILDFGFSQRFYFPQKENLKPDK